MKQLALYLIAIFIVQTELFAQKIETDKIDDFTNDRIIISSKEKVFMNLSDGMQCRVKKINNDFFLSIIYAGKNIHYVDEGNELLIKFKDEKIFKLKNLKASSSMFEDLSANNIKIQHYRLDLIFSLDKDSFDKLKTTLIDKIRIQTNDSFIDGTVKEKDAKKLIKLFNLIN